MAKTAKKKAAKTTAASKTRARKPVRKRVSAHESTQYARLQFKFETEKEAFKAYRFLSLGYELDILPKVEFQLNKNYLIVGWYGHAVELAEVEAGWKTWVAALGSFEDE